MPWQWALCEGRQARAHTVHHSAHVLLSEVESEALRRFSGFTRADYEKPDYRTARYPASLKLEIRR